MHIYTLHIYIHDGFCRQEYWTATEINLFVSCILQYTASMLWTKAQLAPSLQEMSAWKHNGCAVLTLKSGILWPTKIKWKIHTPLFTLHIVLKVFKVLTSCLANIYKIHPSTSFFFISYCFIFACKLLSKHFCLQPFPLKMQFICLLSSMVLSYSSFQRENS